MLEGLLPELRADGGCSLELEGTSPETEATRCYQSNAQHLEEVVPRNGGWFSADTEEQGRGAQGRELGHPQGSFPTSGGTAGVPRPATACCSSKTMRQRNHDPVR